MHSRQALYLLLLPSPPFSSSSTLHICKESQFLSEASVALPLHPRGALMYDPIASTPIMVGNSSLRFTVTPGSVSVTFKERFEMSFGKELSPRIGQEGRLLPGPSLVILRCPSWGLSLVRGDSGPCREGLLFLFLQVLTACCPDCETQASSA